MKQIYRASTACKNQRSRLNMSHLDKRCMMTLHPGYSFPRSTPSTLRHPVLNKFPHYKWSTTRNLPTIDIPQDKECMKKHHSDYKFPLRTGRKKQNLELANNFPQNRSCNSPHSGQRNNQRDTECKFRRLH